MSGIARRSGRKAYYVEMKVAELANMSIEWAVKNFSTMAKSDKMRIVTILGAKFIPQQVDYKVDAEIKHTFEALDLNERINQLTKERLCSAQN